MKKNLIYLLLTLGFGLFAASCEKSVDKDISNMKTSTQIKLEDVFLNLEGYGLTKATLNLNGTDHTILTTPFECRTFDYFKNENGVVEYKFTLLLTKLSESKTTYKTAIASGKFLASQLKDDCNVFVFLQDGEDFKITINGEDPIQP